ncbi:MAG: hypothetical protein K2I80_00440 [Ruminococcus sp.]|nr:hypothetical protein [Ruminococcus sp.]
MFPVSLIPKISKPTAKILIMALIYLLKLILEGMDENNAIKLASSTFGIKSDILRSELKK